MMARVQLERASQKLSHDILACGTRAQIRGGRGDAVEKVREVGVTAIASQSCVNDSGRDMATIRAERGN
jgi:hypothetical protein